MKCPPRPRPGPRPPSISLLVKQKLMLKVMYKRSVING